MIDTAVTVTFLVPQSLVRKIERIRRQRMKEAGGHIARSVLFREALSRLAESDDQNGDGRGGAARQER